MANTPLRADSALCNVISLPTAARAVVENPSEAAWRYRQTQRPWPRLRTAGLTYALNVSIRDEARRLEAFRALWDAHSMEGREHAAR